MKITFGLMAALFSFSVFAAPIKVCKSNVYIPDSETVPTVIEINDVDGKLVGTTTQKIDGETVVRTDDVELYEATVRPGLNAQTSPDEISRGEGLIVHAMIMEEDPVFEGAFKSGIALKKVRSVKVYVVGEATNMGSVSVVEAKDEKGKNLGSFIGGFLVSPCK